MFPTQNFKRLVINALLIFFCTLPLFPAT